MVGAMAALSCARGEKGLNGASCVHSAKLPRALLPHQRSLREAIGYLTGVRCTVSCSGSPPKPPIKRTVSGASAPLGVKPTRPKPCRGGQAAAAVRISHCPCHARLQNSPEES